MPTNSSTTRSTRSSSSRSKKPAAVSKENISYTPGIAATPGIAQQQKAIVDPALFYEREDNADDTFEFRLAATFPGKFLFIRCRRLQLGDVILEGNFPADFTAKVMAGLQDITENAEVFEALQNAENQADLIMAIGKLPALRPLMDAALVTSAIEPRVYLDKDEARANGGIWVESIRMMDKAAFIGLLNEEDAPVAEAFRDADPPQA